MGASGSKTKIGAGGLRGSYTKKINFQNIKKSVEK
jgi:hypothetical protein